MDRKTFLQLPLLAPLLGLQKPEEKKEERKKKPTQRAGGPMVVQCQTCAFYASTSSTLGNCQKNPKQYTSGDQTQAKAWMFPIMASTDKCGEWESSNPFGAT